jgi:hypothetical protein
VRAGLRFAAHLALIAFTAWALAGLFGTRFAPQPLNLAIWLLGGAVLHDLVLLPGYSAVDAGMRRLVGSDARRRVPLVNHVRFPLALCALLFLVWFPLILARQPGNFERAGGHPPPDFLGRWLAVSLSLFALSAIVYAVRRVRVAGAAAPPRPGP